VLRARRTDSPSSPSASISPIVPRSVPRGRPRRGGEDFTHESPRTGARVVVNAGKLISPSSALDHSNASRSRRSHVPFQRGEIPALPVVRQGAGRPSGGPTARALLRLLPAPGPSTGALPRVRVLARGRPPTLALPEVRVLSCRLVGSCLGRGPRALSLSRRPSARPGAAEVAQSGTARAWKARGGHPPREFKDGRGHPPPMENLPLGAPLARSPTPTRAASDRSLQGSGPGTEA
jgi:hypothetical protein